LLREVALIAQFLDLVKLRLQPIDVPFFVFEQAVEEFARPVVAPWFRQAIGYDPAPALRQLKKPVLALYGSLDLQVPAKENLALMKEAFRAMPTLRSASCRA
jgi:pimeloyl-ACP methyl ester carboxylesterase